MKIEISKLKKSYDKPVLKGISAKIEDFDTVAVIGKSGCGKSTLLRLMSGLEPADSGNIIINGHHIDSANIKEYHRNIGIVFQQHNLFPHLSLLRNINLILEKIRGMTPLEAETRAVMLLRQLQLDEEMNKKPKHVSGGQAQRAAIARALSTEPELIFMDEPTASLDPILTREVLDSVLELKRTGTKFIFITHELDFVKQFAEYVLFLDEGLIAEQGEVDILKNPATEKLEQFLLREPLRAVI